MTNKQVLELAVEKATTSGWKIPMDNYEVCDGYIHGNERGGDSRIWIADLIFSHDFAKALWGEKIQPYTLASPTGSSFLDTELLDVHELPAWKFHLQQMVITDDPIKYLGDNMPKDKTDNV